MQDFRNLKVWKSAHQLTLDVYASTRGFPRVEVYGLTSQIRRASASIAANLAEGCGSGSDAAFSRFAQIARASASELEYHLLLAKDLGLLDASIHSRLSAVAIEIKRMLTALIARLKGD